MPRRILEGTVVSDKGDKTISVLVERRTMHPVYKKYVKVSKKFAAHDENNQYKSGDRVQIVETRPISKTKTWAVLLEDGSESLPTTATQAKKPANAEKTLAKTAKKDVKEQTAEKPAAKAAPKTAAKASAKKTTTAAKSAKKETKTDK